VQGRRAFVASRPAAGRPWPRAQVPLVARGEEKASAVDRRGRLGLTTGDGSFAKRAMERPA
jgi:hypothetical protein